MRQICLILLLAGMSYSASSAESGARCDFTAADLAIHMGAFDEVYQDITENQPALSKLYYRSTKPILRRLLINKCVKKRCNRNEIKRLAREMYDSFKARSVNTLTFASGASAALGFGSFALGWVEHGWFLPFSTLCLFVAAKFGGYFQDRSKMEANRRSAAWVAGFDFRRLFVGSDRVAISDLKNAAFNANEQTLEFSLLRVEGFIEAAAQGAREAIKADDKEAAVHAFAKLFRKWMTIHIESFVALYLDNPDNDRVSPYGSQSYSSMMFKEAFYEHFYEPLLKEGVIFQDENGDSLVRLGSVKFDPVMNEDYQTNMPLKEFRRAVLDKLVSTFTRNGAVFPDGVDGGSSVSGTSHMLLNIMRRAIPSVKRWRVINSKPIMVVED